MPWHTTQSLDEFEAATGTFLAADAVRNTILLTIPTALRHRGLHAFGDAPPVFGWFPTSDGQVDAVDAVFVHTPPHPVLLSGLPEQAVAPLVELLAEKPTTASGVSGINAPTRTAEAVAAAWQERTGTRPSTHRHQRLYRLGTLTAPHPAPDGEARTAVEADRELLIGWYRAFGEDVGEPRRANIDRILDDRIAYGGLTLWQVDGAPVAMAGATRPVAGTVGIAPVYTPTHLRGRGYAGAVTAAVSRSALTAGAGDVLLFTDMANPTSNALYQRIGYREVEDRLVLHFSQST
jgi:predicted GNAT family acetyltransferase